MNYLLKHIPTDLYFVEISVCPSTDVHTEIKGLRDAAQVVESLEQAYDIKNVYLDEPEDWEIVPAEPEENT